MASPQPIDQQFSDSYGLSGHQPYAGGVSQVRNVNAEYKNDPTLRRGGKGKWAANDPNYNQSVQRDVNIVDRTSKATREGGEKDSGETTARASGVGQVVSNEGGVTGRTIRRGYRSRRGIRRGKNKIPADQKKLAKKIALGVNIPIRSWGIFTYITFQIPMAVLSIVLFGMAMAVDAFFNSNLGVTENSSWYVKVGAGAVNLVKDGLSALASVFNRITKHLFGFSLDDLHPINFFLVVETVIIGYALLTLMIMYLIYKLAFLNPLSGEKSARKIGVFILIIVGYSLPVFNLIPWFYLWTREVAKHPK